MTLSLNLADFAGTFGFTQDQVPAGSRADYELQVAGDTTSWIDTANKRLLQTAGTAHVSGTFTITGMPGVPADPIGMQGTVSMKLIAA